MKEKRKSTDNTKIKDLLNFNLNNDLFSQKNFSNYKNYKNINNNYNSNYMNDLNSFNKIKLNINKSSRLQNLLSDLKKDKNKDKFKIDKFNNINNEDNNSQNIGDISSNIFNDINNNNLNEEENLSNNENNNNKDLKLFDETMFRKIKERNFNDKNNYRKEFKLKDYETNKNHSHIYLDKVKEDLMNISSPKILERNEINKLRMPLTKLVYSNSTYDLDTEIMPANNMNSLFKKKI